MLCGFPAGDEDEHKKFAVWSFKAVTIQRTGTIAAACPESAGNSLSRRQPVRKVAGVAKLGSAGADNISFKIRESQMNHIQFIQKGRSLIVVTLLLAIQPSVSWGQVRTWTGENGASIDAELVSVSDDGNTVSLRAKDGSVKQGSISMLSSDDRDYIQSHEKAQRDKGLVKLQGRWVSPAEKRAVEQQAAEDEARQAEQIRQKAEEAKAQQEAEQRLLTLQRDASVVADAYVTHLLDKGVLRKASLVGYQKGLGAELIAIFQCEYVSKGGFLNDRQMSAAMSRDREGRWEILDFSPGGVFGGLPLESDWRRATGGGKTPLNRIMRENGF